MVLDFGYLLLSKHSFIWLLGRNLVVKIHRTILVVQLGNELSWNFPLDQSIQVNSFEKLVPKDFLNIVFLA